MQATVTTQKFKYPSCTWRGQRICCLEMWHRLSAEISSILHSNSNIPAATQIIWSWLVDTNKETFARYWKTTEFI